MQDIKCLCDDCMLAPILLVSTTLGAAFKWCEYITIHVEMEQSVNRAWTILTRWNRKSFCYGAIAQSRMLLMLKICDGSLVEHSITDAGADVELALINDVFTTLCMSDDWLKNSFGAEICLHLTHDSSGLSDGLTEFNQMWDVHADINNQLWRLDLFGCATRPIRHT